MKIQTKRFDIVLTSFLYLAGLTVAVIGLLESDPFYSILGIIGIIGASFHIFSVGQRKKKEYGKELQRSKTGKYNEVL